MSEEEKDHAHDHDDHDDHEGPYGADEVHAHIGSYKMYGAVFVALICCTLATVGVASIHLGKANLAVAVIIASIKAALVCTFFMHLKDDNKFNALILIAAITFIGIFFALTLNDVSYREKLDIQSGNKVFLQSGDLAPGSWENPVKKEDAPAPATSGSAAPATSGSASPASSAPPKTE